ncbi:MAG: type 1 glutamine amidotransferase [Sulfuricaulis sp.]
MQEILIFRHTPPEGPGYLEEYLNRRHLPHRLIRVDQNDPIPSSIDGVLGLVWLGGPMSVNDPLPWIPPVMKLIQQATAANLPVLGHCLGGQLISKALGGVVTKNPVKEIGWLPVSRVDGPVANRWLNNLPPSFDVFHWHGETFSIPPGATRILTSHKCTNQAFVIGKTLAFQCHIEMTSNMVREWIRAGTEELTPVCATVQNPTSMTAELDTRIKQLQSIADKFYDRWIQGLS